MHNSPFIFNCALDHRLGLETVHLDLVLFGNLLVDEELLHFGTVITLQLDDFTEFFVIDNSSIASENLFESFQQFLLIDIGGQALNGGESFAAVPLLDAQMDVLTGSLGIAVVYIRGIISSTNCVIEWIEFSKVLNLVGHALAIEILGFLFSTVVGPRFVRLRPV